MMENSQNRNDIGCKSTCFENIESRTDQQVVEQKLSEESCFTSLRFCSGVRSDLSRRLPFYMDDWHCINWTGVRKVSASSVYMFFTSLAPAITFAMLLTNKTNRLIGVLEVLLSTAIGGCTFSLFAGQPLVIVGVTGPIVILTVAMYTLSDSWNIDFLAFYAWAQLWAALMHFLISILNLCDLIIHVTQFSCETFGILIALIFIYDGLHGISEYFEQTDGVDPAMSSVYLQLIIAMGTIHLSLTFIGAKNWTILNNSMRNILSDYGITLAVVLMSSVAYIGRNQGVYIDKLQTPDTFGTTSPRLWLVDLLSLPVWAVFLAIIPGFIITVLFAFDHNISSLMAQAKEYRLQKGSSFHWDFMLLGACMIITGLLGLPPTSGMIPHSFLHTRSLIAFVRGKRQEGAIGGGNDELNDRTIELIATERSRCNAVKLDGIGDERGQILTSVEANAAVTTAADLEARSGSPISYQDTSPLPLLDKVQVVYEQRVSNLVQSLLIGLMCFAPFIRYLQVIPQCTLDGLFVILGVSSFEGNQFFERMIHMISDPKRRTNHAYLQGVSISSVWRLTIVQMVCCGAILGITFSPAAMIFPILIGVLVPIRLYLLPRFIDFDDLQKLDPLNEEEVQGKVVVEGGLKRLKDSLD